MPTVSSSPYSQPHMPTNESSLLSPGQGSLRDGQSALNQPTNSQPTISMLVLMDFIIQKTYHDLTVLAELLPRKTDMERKMEIFGFVVRARMLQVRLLATAKWANSAVKVEKCNQIVSYLDRQSSLFTDTANSLAQMARETLVRATLPNFHLPAAVEVLTLGQYTRVPKCVRERLVPPEPISLEEKRITLLKINQVIEHRLVSSDLPLKMRNLRIENGFVTFIVNNEFEATLTLTGDSQSVPWRLLKLNILVKDKETGEGKPLVHALQVGFLEQFVQHRLMDSVDPLQDLYEIVHSFCQSLQLEVIYNQTMKLIMERLGDFIRVEEYKAGRVLTVSYWRDHDKDLTHHGYKLSIIAEQANSTSSLAVVHTPHLSCKDAEAVERAIRSENLSIEKLLVHTISLRTTAKLNQLMEDLHEPLDLKEGKPQLSGHPAVLSLPILQPCLRSEQLFISINTHTGLFHVHVPQYEANPLVADVQTALNEDYTKIVPLVTQLRYWVIKQRVKKTLQQLPASPYESLPLVFSQQEHILKEFGNNKMFIRLHRSPNSIIVFKFKEKEDNKCEMEFSYFFLTVRPVSVEDESKEEGASTDLPKNFLRALTFREFNSYLVTHGSGTNVEAEDLLERLTGKRKLTAKADAPIKRSKFPSYFISELAHVVAFVDDRIPFDNLALEFCSKRISHSGPDVEDQAIGHCIHIIGFPAVEGVDPGIVEYFEEKYLLTRMIRMQQRGGRLWRVEFTFMGNPVAKIHNSKNGGSRRTVTFTREVGNPESGHQEFTDYLLQEWAQIVHLYVLVDQFEKYFEDTSDTAGLSDVIGIKTYSFRELVLEFGPERKLNVKVLWDSTKARFNLQFSSTDKKSCLCPHGVLKDQFEELFNSTKNLALLGKVLHETHLPLRAVARLPSIPQLGVVHQVALPVQTFSLIPHSTNHLKLFFYNYFALDVFIRPNVILVRDGAISTFDQTKAFEDLHPIPWLKTFLSSYVDEALLVRRPSQPEDDNPPSPMGVADDIGSATGLRFPAPHTPPSNPLTPASPHTSSSSFLQSPPPSIRQPSPAVPPQASPGLGNQHPIPSPANPVGSVGSPFSSVLSPMGVGSPGMNRPSPRPGMSPQPCTSAGQQGAQQISDRNNQPSYRVLPQRGWAGANPTPITHGAFDEMCRPAPVMAPTTTTSIPTNIMLSPLHRFLGCAFLRKQIPQGIKSEQGVMMLDSAEPGTITFKVESLICKVLSYNANSHQSLHLVLEPDVAFSHHWYQDSLTILEKFFDTKVAAPPYRPYHFIAFIRMLGYPLEALKDIVGILRFEMFPDLVVKHNLKWFPRLSLISPAAGPAIIPHGQPGVVKSNEKMLFYLHLTRANITQQLPAGTDPFCLILPIVYDVPGNQTTVATKDTNPIAQAAQQRLALLSRTAQINVQRCTILPSVQDLLLHLTVPNEGPPHQPNLNNMPNSVPVDPMAGFIPTVPINPGVANPMAMNQGLQGQPQQQQGPMGMRAMNPQVMMAQRMAGNPMGMGQHQDFMRHN